MHGARAALFGRKINNSEHQLTFVKFLHAIANGQIDAEEATRAYHGELQKLDLKPYRSLKEDLESTTMVSSYAGTAASAKPQAAPARSDGAPDFSKITSAQKVAYARQRIRAGS